MSKHNKRNVYSGATQSNITGKTRAVPYAGGSQYSTSQEQSFSRYSTERRLGTGTSGTLSPLGWMVLGTFLGSDIVRKLDGGQEDANL